MIKFFSRIRRKLIDEGNLKRYLIYAIGEILLVMIGILLALQVNNWNNDKNDKRTLNTYHIELQKKAESDLKRLDNFINNAQAYIKKAEDNYLSKHRTSK